MLIRRPLLAAAACLLSMCALPAAESGQLDGNLTLFSVVTAWNAARADTPLNIPVYSELRNFVMSHRKPDTGSDLAQYISFALAVTGPPDYRSTFNANEIPPDVLALEGFDKLMTRFYREAKVEEQWRAAQPALEKTLARYQESVARALLEVTSYLRNPTSGYMGRRFQIILEPTAPPNQVQHRSYGDDYTIVITPSEQLQTGEIRHGYLHYLLDPLSIKFSEQINKKRGLIDYAQGAPLLGDQYKTDFLLFTTECLIKAIEAAMSPAAKRQEMVSTALGEGYVLTPYFAEALPAYEKQESAMRLYLPEMIAGIDLRKEARRLQNVEFAQHRAAPPAPPAPTVEPARSPAETALDAAEKAYTERNLADASRQFRALLEQGDDKGIHARAYYGLARIAALQKDPDLAERLFRKTLEVGPDAQTAAWTRVYLGRLAQAAGDQEQARKHFQDALKVEGASEGARRAAAQGLNQ